MTTTPATSTTTPVATTTTSTIPATTSSTTPVATTTSVTTPVATTTSSTSPVKTRSNRHWLSHHHFSSFYDFDQYLATLDNHGKGQLFENFCYDLFSHVLPYCQGVRAISWGKHASKATYEALGMYKHPGGEFGIDLILHLDDGLYDVVQVKWRKHTLNVGQECGTSLLQFFKANSQNIRRYIIICNGQYHDPTEDTDNDFGKHVTYIDGAVLGQKELWSDLMAALASQPPTAAGQWSAVPLTPKAHQAAALDVVPSKLSQGKATPSKYSVNKEHRRGCIFMPTGSGKTKLAIMVAQGLSSVLMCVPSILLARKMAEEWYRHFSPHVLIVSSEHLKNSVYNISTTTDAAVIQNFMADPSDHPKVVVTTYNSSPLVSTYVFDIRFLDEAHHTVSRRDKAMYAIADDVDHCSYQLALTATPRECTRSTHRSLRNEADYGPVLFSYSLDEAITERVCNDYRILIGKYTGSTYPTIFESRASVPGASVASGTGASVPDVVSSSTVTDADTSNVAPTGASNAGATTSDQANKDAIITDTTLMVSCLMMYQAIKEHGNRKILAYHNKTEDATAACKIFDRFFSSMAVPAVCLTIFGNDPAVSRQDKLDQFERAPLAILSTVGVLKEGVDLPCADTVIFASPRYSKVGIIQCIGRALRVLEVKPTSLVLVPFVDSVIDKESNSLTPPHPHPFEDDTNTVLKTAAKTKKNRYAVIAAVLEAMAVADRSFLESIVIKADDKKKIRCLTLGVDAEDKALLAEETAAAHDQTLAQVLDDTRLYVLSRQGRKATALTPSQQVQLFCASLINQELPMYWRNNGQGIIRSHYSPELLKLQQELRRSFCYLSADDRNTLWSLPEWRWYLPHDQVGPNFEYPWRYTFGCLEEWVYYNGLPEAITTSAHELRLYDFYHKYALTRGSIALSPPLQDLLNSVIPAGTISDIVLTLKDRHILRMCYETEMVRGRTHQSSMVKARLAEFRKLGFGGKTPASSVSQIFTTKLVPGGYVVSCGYKTGMYQLTPLGVRTAEALLVELAAASNNHTTC